MFHLHRNLGRCHNWRVLFDRTWQFNGFDRRFRRGMHSRCHFVHLFRRGHGAKLDPGRGCAESRRVAR